MDGAHGVLLNISGGSDLGLFEINAAAELVAEAAHPEANIIFGAVIDDALGDEVRVTVIAAGFDEAGTRHVLTAQPVMARPRPDARAAAPAAASYSADSSRTSNGHFAGGQAREAAPDGRLARQEAVAVQPAASVTDPPDPSREPVGSHGEDTGSVDASSDTDSSDQPEEEAEPVAAAVPARHRADAGAAARMFDAATTTRRRSVVFEEDDELDVPDFLK